MYVYISSYASLSKMVLQYLVLSLIKSREPLEIPNSECRNAIYIRLKERKKSPSMYLFHFILNHPLLFTIYKIKYDIKVLYRFKGQFKVCQIALLLQYCIIFVIKIFKDFYNCKTMDFYFLYKFSSVISIKNSSIA